MKVELQYKSEKYAILGEFNIERDHKKACSCVLSVMSDYVAARRPIDKNVDAAVYGDKNTLIVELTGDEPPSDVVEIINGLLLERCEKYLPQKRH